MKKNKLKLMLLGTFGSIVSISSLGISCGQTKPQPENPSNPKNEDPERPKDSGGNEGPKVIVEPEIPTRPTNPGVGLNIPGMPELYKTDPAAYKKLSESEKNVLDLQGYVKALKDYRGDYSSKLAANLKLTPEQIEEYDRKAQAAGQPSFESAVVRNFSVVNADGTLSLNPLRDDTKAAYWDSVPLNRGLPRYLANEMYKKTALQSYAIKLSNTNPLIEQNRMYNGSAWILDYKLDENGYPTKWYIGTNIHVIQAFAASTANASSQSRFKHINDLQAEADSYNKYTKVVKDADAEYNKLMEEVNAKIKAKDDEIKSYEDKKYIALSAGNQAEADRYEKQALAVRENDLPPLYAEAKRIEVEEWSPKWLAKYNEAKNWLKQGVIGETVNIQLFHFNDETPIDQWLRVNELQPTVDVFSFKPSQVKLVYAGLDFLKTSPRDYVDPNSPLSELEEAADFAVLEFDFSNSDNTYEYNKIIGDPQDTFGERKSVSSAAELAKLATSNFANWNENEKFKFATKSLKATYQQDEKTMIPNVRLTNDKTASIPKSKINLISVAFPDAKTDHLFIRKMLEPSEVAIIDSGFSQSIWTNKPVYVAEGQQVDKKVFTKEYGSGWNKSLSVRNFIDMPGVFDITIVSPLINSRKNEGYKFGVIRDSASTYTGDRYLSYGLGYSIGAWQPLFGASGSSVRTIDNEIVGINYATADSTGVSLTALTQAFRSEGETYDGFYGKYKLEQYDLIYGGGENQRSSYREALQELYPNIQTYLFKQGANLIPEEYKFNK
ncbi:Ig-specific serine endopeptidase MIP [Mycoplasma sp. 4404]|uniref:Ig-specific serine endopeptidase MIP n=1 Tax=Mycoplasma sp. 4404 TaxID=3108530 RepID=UPI002B1CE2F5|nr:DUF31 family protein [Mycoplasma sp. 4404]MEA4162640.1 DUF31 family protein [Mycoplasma sp. 4404]